jgi:hypothetical protein
LYPEFLMFQKQNHHPPPIILIRITLENTTW